MTGRGVSDRLVEIGMVPPEDAAKALAAIGFTAPDGEMGHEALLDLLDECGATVWVPDEPVDDLEQGYAAVLERAAGCGGGAVAVGDVELVRDERGEESLHFLRDGEPVWWQVEHEPDGRLDHMTIMECIDDLEPGGDDPRMFYAVPGDGDGEGGGDLYVLATPEQARALHDELAIDLEGLALRPGDGKPRRGAPPTAEPGTPDWYAQDDRRTMTAPARAFLDAWTAGMAEALDGWRAEHLPGGFPFDFSLGSLDALESLVLERHPDWDSVIAAGSGPFVEGAVRYVGETLLRAAPSRWGYQDLGLSDAHDRIPMIRSNTPPGFMQTVIPLHRLAVLAKTRDRGTLRESVAFLDDAVAAHERAVRARRR